jgi:hypothetical protein
MREQIQARLEELKKELDAGQAELQKVEMQRTPRKRQSPHLMARFARYNDGLLEWA